MFNSTRLITAALDNMELSYDFNTVSDTREVVSVSFGSRGTCHFFCAEKNNNISVRSDIVATIPEEKAAEALVLLNHFNQEARFVKTCMYDSLNIVLEMDISKYVADDCLGDVALECITRVIKHRDEIYPQLMKLIWG